jgi:hypothetical protein
MSKLGSRTLDEIARDAGPKELAALWDISQFMKRGVSGAGVVEKADEIEKAAAAELRRRGFEPTAGKLIDCVSVAG